MKQGADSGAAIGVWATLGLVTICGGWLYFAIAAVQGSNPTGIGSTATKAATTFDCSLIKIHHFVKQPCVTAQNLHEFLGASAAERERFFPPKAILLFADKNARNEWCGSMLSDAAKEHTYPADGVVFSVGPDMHAWDRVVITDASIDGLDLRIDVAIARAAYARCNSAVIPAISILCNDVNASNVKRLVVTWSIGDGDTEAVLRQERIVAKP